MPHMKNEIIEIPASPLKVENRFVSLEIRNILNKSILIIFNPQAIEQKCTLFQDSKNEILNLEQITSKINYIQENHHHKTDNFSFIRSMMIILTKKENPT